MYGPLISYLGNRIYPSPTQFEDAVREGYELWSCLELNNRTSRERLEATWSSIVASNLSKVSDSLHHLLRLVYLRPFLPHKGGSRIDHYRVAVSSCKRTKDESNTGLILVSVVTVVLFSDPSHFNVLAARQLMVQADGKL